MTYVYHVISLKERERGREREAEVRLCGSTIRYVSILLTGLALAVIE